MTVGSIHGNESYLRIGGTPTIRLPDTFTGGGCVMAKLEKYNPFSSVKDRVAWYMLEGAERRGQIVRGSGTIVEATSGNTGIALAGFASVRGYRAIIVMPDSASEERIALLRYLGAEVVLTPSEYEYPASIRKAENICAETPSSWFAYQHENYDNIVAHYETTGQELSGDLNGRIDVLVCGVGTGGTISGIAKFLKEQNPNIRVVAVEPERSAVLSGMPGGRHQIYGLNGGFIAKTTIVDLIDEVVTVSDESAWDASSNLKKLGLLVGISSGAVAHVARNIALKSSMQGKIIATIFPDGGERYVSLFSKSG